MRFYLDEALSNDIAGAARRLGVDVISSHEVGKNALSDDLQLTFATQEGRCLVTTNRRDFIRLGHDYARDARRHAGILLLARSVGTTRRDSGALARALQQFDALHPDGVAGETHWLTGAV